MKAAALALGMAGALILGGTARAADPAPNGPVPITIVVFTPPSLGAVFPAIIKQQKYDIATASTSISSSARPTPMRRSSTPASSRSAAAPRS